MRGEAPRGTTAPVLLFQIIELLNEINKQGTTIIVVTHEHDLVQKFKNRVIEIQGGEVISDTGAPEEKAEVPIEISARELKEIPEEIAEEIPDVTSEELNREALAAIVDGEAAEE